MIILDTNVISEVMRASPNPTVVAWLEAIPGDESVCITAVTLAELLAGLQRMPAGRRKSDLTAMLTAVLEEYRDAGAILPFDEKAVAKYAEVLTIRERAGAPIATADAQIAAICLAHHASCATRNEHDFEHAGVELVNPWKAA